LIGEVESIEIRELNGATKASLQFYCFTSQDVIGQAAVLVLSKIEVLA
jgi:hypothetical protein